MSKQLPARAELDAAMRAYNMDIADDGAAVRAMLDALYGTIERFDFWLTNALANATGAEWDALNRVREAWEGRAKPDERSASTEGSDNG